MTSQLRELRARRARHEGGFTLIELLVVIIIIGVIAGVVVFAVRGAGDKGQSAATSADVKTLRTAQEAYCARYGTYAATDAELVNKKFLSETGTLHGTRQITPGPCGGTGFVTTCNPTTETGCGQNGTVADPALAGKATGSWAQTGDLPGGCVIPGAATTAATTNQQCLARLNGLDGSLLTMKNGKALFFPDRNTGQTSCTSTTTTQPLVYPNTCQPNVLTTSPTSTYSFKPYDPPVMVFNPATASWAKTPALPGGLVGPGGPSAGTYLPLVFGGMQLLEGTSAECGVNCGKVFVRMQVISNSSTSNTGIKAVNTGSLATTTTAPTQLFWPGTSNPLWPNAMFYLFDPAVSDAGVNNPWTLIPDPGGTTPADSFILSKDGMGPTQVRNCTRAAATDCGKVMMAGGGDDAYQRRGNAGGYTPTGGTAPLTQNWHPNTSGRTAFWDPKTFDPTAPTNAPWSRDMGNFLFPDPGVRVLGTQLANGKVLATTGAYSAVYDGAARTWTKTTNNVTSFTFKCDTGTGPLWHMTFFSNSIVRADGTVLMPGTMAGAGGCDASTMVPWDNAGDTDNLGTQPTPAPNNGAYNSLIFDPATNSYKKSPPDPSVPDYCPCATNGSPGTVMLPALQGNRIFSVYANAVAPQAQSFYSANGNSPFTTVSPALSQNLQLSTTAGGWRPFSMAVLPTGQVLVAGRELSTTGVKVSAHGGKETYLYTPPIA